MRFTTVVKMAQNKMLEGVFAINKPIGMSSAQVIRDCQNYFDPSAAFAPLLAKEKAHREREFTFQKHRRRKGKQELHVKMGHGGTLDPLATGVLILGVGKGTKSLQEFLYCTKTYEAVVLFGASTDTYDRVGRIIKRGNYEGVTREAFEKALEGFRGKIKQMPPLYSALKMEGKPLYEYAREGKPIPREIETRDVEVQELKLVEWYEPGTHPHRWPTEEAEQAEKNLAKSVWNAAQRRAGEAVEETSKSTSGQQKETEASQEQETSKKRVAEEDDAHETKKQKITDGTAEPVMSGALGSKPPKPKPGRGSNLIPAPPSPDTPPPWEGKGPPAAKILMTVTSGFYVRSLCHDLGEKLGSGAMMAELSRTRQGNFVLGGANCMEYSDLLEGEETWAPKVEAMLDLWNNPVPEKAEAAAVSSNGDGAAPEQTAGKQSEPVVEGNNVSDAAALAEAQIATSPAVN